MKKFNNFTFVFLITAPFLLKADKWIDRSLIKDTPDPTKVARALAMRGTSMVDAMLHNLEI